MVSLRVFIRVVQCCKNFFPCQLDPTGKDQGCAVNAQGPTTGSAHGFHHMVAYETLPKRGGGHLPPFDGRTGFKGVESRGVIHRRHPFLVLAQAACGQAFQPRRGWLPVAVRIRRPCRRRHH